jgi:hypothetical protein
MNCVFIAAFFTRHFAFKKELENNPRLLAFLTRMHALNAWSSQRKLKVSPAQESMHQIVVECVNLAIERQDETRNPPREFVFKRYA